MIAVAKSRYDQYLDRLRADAKRLAAEREEHDRNGDHYGYHTAITAAQRKLIRDFGDVINDGHGQVPTLVETIGEYRNGRHHAA